MRMILCDDDVVFVKSLKEQVEGFLREYPEFEWEITECYNGNDLLDIYNQKKFDVVLLDVDMPGMSGYEISKKLTKKSEKLIVIFVSGVEEKKFYSYEYNPFWYVSKSELFLLPYVMQKMIQKLRLESLDVNEAIIKLENKKEKIDLENTLYFMSDDHYVDVKLLNQDKEIGYRHKLSDVQKQLSDYWFVRIHHGYLVNCRLIESFDKNSCKLINGEILPVSRKKSDDAREIFQNYLRMVREVQGNG